MADRKPYPTDVSDEEWAFVAPYLILFPLDTGQRRHDLREVFNALRYVVRTGCPWRMLPNDLPLWSRAHQQMQRWFKAGCFEAIVHDSRMLLRLGSPTGLRHTRRHVFLAPVRRSSPGRHGPG